MALRSESTTCARKAGGAFDFVPESDGFSAKATIENEQETRSRAEARLRKVDNGGNR